MKVEITNTAEITNTIDVEDKLIEDLFCTALEGGSNYWYCILHHNKEKDQLIYKIPFIKHGFIIISDDVGDDKVKVNRERIEKGLALFIKKEFKRWERVQEGQYDAEDADIFLQYVVFGKVIYG